MRKILSLCIATILLISIIGCGKAPTWQEQYDLGIRYLSESNYEEAIIAFTAAIEIDPKQSAPYVGRGDAYVAMGEYIHAEDDYKYALKLDSSLDLRDKLTSLNEKRKAELTERLQEELYPYIENLDIPFTVDDITLGVTDIETAKAIYSSRPYAKSNLMNNDSDDTVYTCFGLDMPIPEGHEENEFGFLFVGPADGGAVYHISVCDPDAGLNCFEGIHVGDSDTDVLSFFGLPEGINMDDLHLRWTLKNGAELSYYSNSIENFSFTYQLVNYRANVDVRNGIVYGAQLDVVG